MKKEENDKEKITKKLEKLAEASRQKGKIVARLVKSEGKKKEKKEEKKKEKDAEEFIETPVQDRVILRPEDRALETSLSGAIFEAKVPAAETLTPISLQQTPNVQEEQTRKLEESLIDVPKRTEETRIVYETNYSPGREEGSYSASAQYEKNEDKYKASSSQVSIGLRDIPVQQITSPFLREDPRRVHFEERTPAQGDVFIREQVKYDEVRREKRKEPFERRKKRGEIVS
jgi:hypothetical protein